MRNNRSSLLTTPSSQSNLQSKLTRLYNQSLSDIEKSFAFNPEKIFSQRINRWLNHQFDVRLLDQGALSWYLLGSTAHLCSGIFIYRNNREPVPNNLYSFLVCGSAFGISAFYRHFFEGISICPVYNEDDVGAILPGINESLANVNENLHFLDEMSRGGLLKQLHQNDKILLLDEADCCLKRNGLIPEGPIGEHNNIYEIVLTLYSGQATVTKCLTNSTTNLRLKKLTILANTTEEPILRLLKKKMLGDAPNPFAERSLFLFISTPLTLEKPFPPLWNFNQEPTISQIVFTASQLNNLDFYYETTARLMTIAYGNLLCKLMIKNEKIDKWFTARLGKSREHLHRLAVNLQLLQLIFDLIDKYKHDFGNLNHGLNDSVFQQRMQSVINGFLGRTTDQTRVKLEVRLSIANSAVKLLNLILNQYLCIFTHENVYLSTDDSQISDSVQEKFDNTTASTITFTTPTTTNKNDESAPTETAVRELARSILLCDEIVFTKTKLSHCVPLWKRKKNCHEAAIQLLLEKKLIEHCEKAAKQTVTRRNFDMWIKRVPLSDDITHLNDFCGSLSEFNINWDTFQRTLRKFQPPPGVIINDKLASLLKSEQYQKYIEFNVDSLTIPPGIVGSSVMNELQNNNVLNHNEFNTPTVSVINESTTSISDSPSTHQQSSQSISISNPVLPTTCIPADATNSIEIPIQQSAVLNQATLLTTSITPQFRLPRPVDLATTRLKQTAVNRSRAANKKQAN